MKPRPRWRTLFLLGPALAVAFALAWPRAASPATEPRAQTDLPQLSFDDVLQLLDAGVTPVRVKTLVTERGVDFLLKEAGEQRLRAVGATDELLLQIVKSYRPRTPPPPPKKAGAPNPPRLEEMKIQFENGMGALEQAEEIRAQIRGAAADQRPALERRAAELVRVAIDYFQRAKRIAAPGDPGQPVVLANLGRAYEALGSFEEACPAYGEAATLQPGNATYFLAWGTALARAGKVSEAGGVCDRVAASDASTAAACWRNVAIVLFNAAKLADAVAPLRRSVALEPANGLSWYLLASTMVATIEFRRSQTRLIPVVQEGTEDAYRKYLAADPGGRFAREAQAALQALQNLRGGIETKIEQGPPTLMARGKKEYPQAGRGVPAARLVEQPAPAYPILAKVARIQGKVELLAVVGKDGSVIELEAVSGHPLLYPAALEAVRKWRYQPTLIKGQPAEVSTPVAVRFTLQQ